MGAGVMQRAAMSEMKRHRTARIPQVKHTAAYLLLLGMAGKIYKGWSDPGGGHGLSGRVIEGELPGAEASLIEQLMAGRRLGSPAA